jgi:GT2 family glycosyltransferase
MLIRRSAIQAVGGFDEHFIFNHADGDLFVRLKREGFKIIYNPKMCAIHYLRIGPSRYPYFIGRDTAYFYLKDIRPRSLKGILAALTNLALLNVYWIYKTIQLKDLRQLLGISGFLKGILDYTRRDK